MKHFLTLLLISLTLISALVLSACDSVFVEPAFTEREYFDNDLSWAMNQAYNAEYGFEGLCERRSLHAQELVPGSYVIGMTLKKEKRRIGKRNHAILCKDKICVDSTGIIADRYTTFPESELVYHAYDIKPVYDYKLSQLK